MNIKKIILILSVIIVVLTITAAAFGLFFTTNGQSYFTDNLYGESIEIFGNGLYAHESSFKAPINKGTDAVMLFIVVPLFIVTLFFFNKGKLKNKIFHLGLLACLLYYASSIAFGNAYNILFLVYLLLFASCLFATILSIHDFDFSEFKKHILPKYPHKTVFIFLIVAGLSVFVWLLEIIASLQSCLPPATIGMNTTEPTFIIDIGVIAPLAFLGAYLIKKREPLGYLLSFSMITLNAVIGMIVISQTFFQLSYDVGITVEEFIPYVSIFVLMSIIAIGILMKSYKNVEK